jgi:peptidoglycan-associated lipoprotein
MQFVLKTLGLVTILAFLGCSSSKKADSLADGSASVDGSGQRSLKLGGDSDSLSAGEISTVYFAFDSASLDEVAKSTLTANAEYLKSNANLKMQVEGHCDERGGVQYNLALSEKRAKSVLDFLKGLGVAANRLTTIGYGKERPIDMGHDESAWAKNRRANFVVTAQ